VHPLNTIIIVNAIPIIFGVEFIETYLTYCG
jgi:hypothetical protein